MHKTIRAWLEAEERVRKATEEADALKREARQIEPPPRERLREATASDIREGVFLWYIEDDCAPCWQMVYEVISPSDPWKAYIAEDGCRYGLDGAYVEIGDD